MNHMVIVSRAHVHINYSLCIIRIEQIRRYYIFFFFGNCVLLSIRLGCTINFIVNFLRFVAQQFYG